jgi:hypothetical protein
MESWRRGARLGLACRSIWADGPAWHIVCIFAQGRHTSSSLFASVDIYLSTKFGHIIMAVSNGEAMQPAIEFDLLAMEKRQHFYSCNLDLATGRYGSEILAARRESRGLMLCLVYLLDLRTGWK